MCSLKKKTLHINSAIREVYKSKMKSIEMLFYNKWTIRDNITCVNFMLRIQIKTFTYKNTLNRLL